MKNVRWISAPNGNQSSSLFIFFPSPPFSSTPLWTQETFPPLWVESVSFPLKAPPPPYSGKKLLFYSTQDWAHIPRQYPQHWNNWAPQAGMRISRPGFHQAQFRQGAQQNFTHWYESLYNTSLPETLVIVERNGFCSTLADVGEKLGAFGINVALIWDQFLDFFQPKEFDIFGIFKRRCTEWKTDQTHLDYKKVKLHACHGWRNL